MKKYLAVPVIAAAVLGVTATGAYAAARAFDRDHAEAQANGSDAKCLGKTVTIRGYDAVVTGTSKADVIVSLYYGAEVYGLGGDDTICLYNIGSSGYGGEGRDVIWADANVGHLLSGGPGDDVLLAQNEPGKGSAFGGDNVMVGGEGNDVIYGGSGKEALIGFRGDDKIRGGDGVDYIRGGSGTDSVNGEGGTDLLVDGN